MCYFYFIFFLQKGDSHIDASCELMGRSYQRRAADRLGTLYTTLDEGESTF